MKLFTLILLIANIASAVSPKPSPSAAPKESGSSSSNFSLEQAKKHAILHNFEVLALKSAAEESRALSRRARSAYFPTLGVAGGADSEIYSNGDRAVSVGYIYGNYNLFNGFGDAYRTEVADLEYEKAKVKLERTEFRVGLDVEQVFHLYLFKKGALDLKEEALKLNEKHKKMAFQRKANGMASEADLMEFDLKESILKSDILLLQQELESARAQLKRLLGEEVGAKIEPVGTLQHQHLKGSLMDYVNRIKNESEPVLLSSRSLQAATVESKLWRTKWLPRLDLEVKAGYLPLIERPASGGASLSAMVLAKVDLFSGFDTVSEKQQMEAKRLRSEAELKNSLLSAVTDMEIAYRKIKTIQSRVDLEEQNASRSDRYYKVVLSEYGRGVKNSADLKVAADQVYEVHLRREGYKYDFLNEKLALERALGGKVETDIVQEEHEH